MSFRFPAVTYTSKERSDRFAWALEQLWPGTTRSEHLRDYMEKVVKKAEKSAGKCPIDLRENHARTKEEGADPG